MKRNFLPLVFAVLSAFCFIFLFSIKIQAATYTVTTTADSGDGSLRSAIAFANLTTEDDTISFSIPENDSGCNANNVCTITLSTVELAINSVSTAGKLTILNSSGASKLLISGNNQIRIFYLNQFADLTLNGLTITNGSGTGTKPNDNQQGGAICNINGSLTIISSIITNNQVTSGKGGGIYSFGILTVLNSTISNNKAQNGGGGGIYGASNTVNISNTIISSNTAGYGGGIVKHIGNSLTLTNSSVTGNTADSSDGGGVYNYSGGMLEIINSSISENTANLNGGGIESEGGKVVMTNSTVNGNKATQNKGGGINGGDITLTGSTISSNQAVYGGGIYTNFNTILTNSTVSGNTAANSGGGICNINGTINLTSVTLTNNNSTNMFAATNAGGILNNSGTANLFNTIIAGNSIANSSAAPDFSGSVSSTSSYNIIGKNQGMTGITNGVNGNQVGNSVNPVNPLLSPLANNGGPTQTHRLQLGSPAIDKGSGFDLNTDQRSSARPIDLPSIVNAAGGDGSDIGAFELQSLSVSIEGTVRYGITSGNQNPKFVTGVILSATGTSSNSATTDSSGFYLIDNLQAGGNYTVTPSKTGNINGITAFDATLVLRCVAAGNSCALTANQKTAADTDEDTNVTAFDATQILRFVAANGQNQNTGQVGNWKFVDSTKTYNQQLDAQSNQNYSAFLVGEIDGDWIP